MYFPLGMPVGTAFVRNDGSRTKTCQTVSSNLDEMGTSSKFIAAIELEGCCDNKHGMIGRQRQKKTWCYLRCDLLSYML